MNIDHNHDGTQAVTMIRGTRRQVARTFAYHGKRAALDPVVKSVEQHKHILPNDKCPCGSNKKFKHCHQYK